MVSVSFLLAMHCLSPCRAQTPPEAMVLVQAAGDTTLIVLTYARREPRENVRRVVQDLARRSGAQILQFTVSDVPLDDGDGRTRQRSPVQTSAEVYLRGAAFVLQDAFVLQPFVETLKAVGRFDILFLNQPGGTFAGLTRYEGGGVEVRLVQSGNPYRYSVSVARGTTTIPILPLRQPVAPANTSSGTDAGQVPGRAGLVWLVVGASATAIAVFVVLRSSALRRAR